MQNHCTQGQTKPNAASARRSDVTSSDIPEFNARLSGRSGRLQFTKGRTYYQGCRVVIAFKRSCDKGVS